MMRRLGLATALMLFAAAPAWAEAISVRSGDHADFARLVLDFDASQGWQLGRVDGGWEFRAARTDVAFDLSRVFRLIPRNRITGVTAPAPGVLRILVGCACHIDGFELRRSRVVIDVKDGPAPAGNPFEARLQDPPTVPAAMPGETETAEPAADVDPEAEPRSEPPGEVAEGFAEALRLATLGKAAGSDSDANGPTPKAAIVDFEADLARAGAQQGFEQMILDQLARAASQGLILPAEMPKPGRFANPDTKSARADLDAAGVVAVDIHPDRDPETGPPAGSVPNVADPEAPDAAPDDHIRIETAVDRDGHGAGPAPGDLTAVGHVCPSRGRIDLTGWGYLRGGAPAIDEYRAGLTGEFDQVDPERAMKLARYYVFLTFGAEARQMLGFVPRTHPDWSLIDAMAEILDHEGSAPAGKALEGYETCDSEAALWAVLAGSALRPDQEVDESAVIRTFGDLPAHAKTLLGPRLVAAFTAAHRLEAAAMLRNALDLGATERTVEAAVANARLDTAMGDPQRAEVRLDAALAETDADAPAALLALAEHRLDKGEALDPGMTEALEALAYERQDTGMAGQFSWVLARAALAGGDHAEARALILTRLDPNDLATRKLLRDLYLDAAGTADAEPFLRLVLPQTPGLGNDPIDRPVRLALATRLLSLGFPGDTLALLGPGAAAGEDRDARLLAARALLADGQPGLAAAALAALDGPEAAGLMARVQESLGNIAEARRLYAGAGQPAEADRMAVLDGDWAGLAAAADPALRTFAERFAQPVGSADPTAEPYDAAAQMIEASARDRAALDALLQRP